MEWPRWEWPINRSGRTVGVVGQRQPKQPMQAFSSYRIFNLDVIIRQGKKRDEQTKSPRDLGILAEQRPTNLGPLPSHNIVQVTEGIAKWQKVNEKKVRNRAHICTYIRRWGQGVGGFC